MKKYFSEVGNRNSVAHDNNELVWMVSAGIHLPSRDIGRCISSGSRSAGGGTPARVKGGSLAQ